MITFALPILASAVVLSANPQPALLAMASHTTTSTVRPHPTPRPRPTPRPKPPKPTPPPRPGSIAWNTQYTNITADSLQLTLKERVFGRNMKNLSVTPYFIFNGPPGSVVDRTQLLAQWEENGKEVALYFTLVIDQTKAPQRVWKATAVDAHIFYLNEGSSVQYNTQAMIYDRNPLVSAPATKPWISPLFEVNQDNGYPQMKLVMKNVRITGFLNDPQYATL